MNVPVSSAGAAVSSVKLASGGHATVWLTRTKSGELVARKKPHPHLVDDADVRDALRREAEIALRLKHPNVVRLRSIELDEEAPVLVMDYVDGATVAELIRDWNKDDPRSVVRTAPAAIRIVLDAAAGLHALHELRSERGEPLALVHRDVSPQNVLVGLDGRARISDFGLAKYLGVDRATTEGVLKGKAGYLAPEYVRGRASDRRLDLFSLGVVAWEVIARARLFRGENDAQTLDFVLSMPIPSVANKAPELAAAASELDRVLERALARDPFDRFATAAEFAEALEAAASRAGLLGTAADVTHAFSDARIAELENRKRLLDAPAATSMAPPASATAAAPTRTSARGVRLAVVGAVVVLGSAAAAAALRAPRGPAVETGTSARAANDAEAMTVTSATSATAPLTAASSFSGTGTGTGGEGPQPVNVASLDDAKTEAGSTRPNTATKTPPRRVTAPSAPASAGAPPAAAASAVGTESKPRPNPY